MSENSGRTSIDGAVIASKTRTILASLLEVDESDIEPTTRLEDLGADSLLFLELFEELKDEFKLDVDLHQLGKYAARYKISTVGELTDLVCRYAEKGDLVFTEQDPGPQAPQPGDKA